MLDVDLPDRQLLDAAPDAMLVVDRRGVIVLANQQAGRLFGYSREEMLGYSVEMLIPQTSRSQHSQDRTAFFNSSQARSMGQGRELLGLCKDGRKLPVEISLSPVASSRDKWVVAAIRDVSEHRALLANIQAQNEFSEQLVDTLQGIVLVLDGAGRVERANDFFCQLSGYQRSEIIGRDWFDLCIPSDERKKIRTFFRAAMQEGLNNGYTNAVQLKSGEQRLISWRSVTLPRVGPQIECMLCTGHDVSELTAARETAESATKLKTRFLAAASHDLRQPLQSTGLYLSVLDRSLEQSKQKAISEKMRMSLEAMGQLLDTLLDVSILDSGTVIPEKCAFGLRNVLRHVVAENEPQAKEKGLQMSCAETDCVVYTDPGLVERVLDNFVSNAIRYTDSGKILIECHRDRDVIRVSVSDTGIGIPGADLDNIFEEYYQLDNPVRDRRNGLGLGLSIVKNIARLLDHEIAVSSELGEGSSFSVELPIHDSAPAPVEMPIAEPLVAKSAPKVLFVDDDPAIVDATRMLLESSSIDIHCAGNFEEAMAHIASGVRPGIVISDYRLPGKNGIEVVQMVREATVPELPSVLMTGDTSAEEIRASGLENCTILHKPVSTERLIALIEEANARTATPPDLTGQLDQPEDDLAS